MNSKTLNNIFKGDKVIWMIFFFLCMISIVEVYSASSSLSYLGGNYWAPMVKHIGLLLLGLFFMLVTLNLDCKYFKALIPLLIVVSPLLLLTVLFTGETVNGANRWINFFGIPFQPSEIAKGTMVLISAQILSVMQTDAGASKSAFKWIFWITLGFTLGIALENLSTAMLLDITIFLMMFIARIPGKYLGRLVGAVLLAACLAIGFIMLVGSEDRQPSPQQLTEQTAKHESPSKTEKIFHRVGTWRNRILKFADNKSITPAEVDLDKDGQVAHANIAIATSNVIGKGPGNSVERDFLSQAFSDFIYAIIIEELGIFGAIGVAGLYIILLFRTGRIASRCENNFPAFLAMGLTILLVTQAIFNMLVAVGLAPVTGQPLPLISKGGTSTIINCIYIGAILSVSRSAKKREPEKEEESRMQVA